MNGTGSAYLMDELAEVARATGEWIFRADLMTVAVEAPAFYRPRVMASLEYYHTVLLDLLARHRGLPPRELVAAELMLAFDFSRVHLAESASGYVVPFRCEVRVRDAANRAHVGQVEGDWLLTNEV